MIKVVSIKNATIGNFDALHYHNTERGIVGVTPAGVGVNLVQCKKQDAQSIVQAIHSQIGKREGIMDIDAMYQPGGQTGNTNGTSGTPGGGTPGMGR